jgi:hypothetical protein
MRVILNQRSCQLLSLFRKMALQKKLKTKSLFLINPLTLSCEISLLKSQNGGSVNPQSRDSALVIEKRGHLSSTGMSSDFLSYHIFVRFRISVQSSIWIHANVLSSTRERGRKGALGQDL